MATWAMRKRYEWIAAKVEADEPFNREDIVAAFTVTKQTASATVREYQALHPDTLKYDGRAKAFVAVTGFWSVQPQNWQVNEDAAIERLCLLYGFGAVMQSAARQWLARDPIGALTVGPCAVSKP